MAEPTGPVRGVRGAAADGRAGARPGVRGARAAGQSWTSCRGAGRDDARDASRLDGDAGRRAPASRRPVAAQQVLPRSASPCRSPPTRRSARGRISSRAGLQESRYALADPAAFGRAATAPPLVAVARYVVEGSPVDRPRGREAPRGEAAVRRRPARGAQSCRVWASPCRRSPRWCRSPAQTKRVELQVDVVHNAEAATQRRRRAHAARRLDSRRRRSSRSRSRAPASGPAIASPCRPSTIDAKPYRVEAVATAAGAVVSRGLRAHRRARPRAALPVSAVDRGGARHRRHGAART